MREAIASQWLGTGIYTRLFESALARETGMPMALATNSGTAALHLALKVLGVEGGEVITTPVTSPATNHAILYNGADPVFCDIEADTGNIDPTKIEALITPKTRAIVAVHLGHACDMDSLLAVARRHRLSVLEDVCANHAVGGLYKDRPLGSMSDIACFSFGRFKALTTLDGGAVAFDRPGWRDRLVSLRRLGHREEEGGMARGPRGLSELGYHYRMNDLAAAMGLTQLERKESILRRLDAIHDRYRQGLAGLSFLEFPRPKPYSRGLRSHAVVKALRGRGPALRRHLTGHGIETNDWFYPNHLFDLYKPYRRGRLPVAERYCEEMTHLPFYPDLKDAEVDRVVSVVRRFRA